MADEAWFWREGRLSSASEPLVSPLDRAYTLGDAVFTTLRTFGRRPFHLPEHLARLAAGGEAARIALPPPAALDSLVHEALQAVERRAENSVEWRVRLSVSRGLGGAGPGTRGLVAVPPSALLQPLDHGLPLALEPVTVHVARTVRVPHEAVPPVVKSHSGMPLVLARLEAEEAGASEALLLNRHGRLAEATSANLFLVEGGRLLTPPLSEDVLPGVTRDHLLRLAPRAGLEAVEEPLAPARLRKAAEVFLSGTTHTIMPVASIGSQRLTAPGPATRRLAKAFEGDVEQALKEGRDP